jgi:hypothetical protein
MLGWAPLIDRENFPPVGEKTVWMHTLLTVRIKYA